MTDKEIALLYAPILTIVFTIVSVLAFAKYHYFNANQVLYGKNTNFKSTYFWCAILVLVIGLRPVSGVFVDMPTYKNIFVNINIFNDERDWMFFSLVKLCHDYTTLSGYFLILAAGYICTVLCGFKSLFKNNTSAAMILFVSAFSFQSYAVNGIRNGLAASIFLMGICLFASDGKKIKHIIGMAICVCSIFFHSSMILPVICLALAYFVRNFKFAVWVWIICILLFLVAQGFAESLFSSFDFDDRLNSYIENTRIYAREGFRIGFRPDFIIYSSMPILLGYYINIKKKIVDRKYQFLLNTYIFANSIWCLLQGVSYSNRFAYLSWFLYPLVLGYPCLKMDVWGQKQGDIAGKIILVQALFTFFMNFVYYA